MSKGFQAARMVRYDRWIRNKNLKAIAYQRKAVEWALERELRFTEETRGGILADEMGMGKTFMMLGTIMANPNPGLTLLVVPPALLEQWCDVIGKFMSNEKGFLVVYHGPKAKNMVLTEDVLNFVGTRIVLTTYGMMANRKRRRGETEQYQSPIWGINWYRTIYDEAHHMRNRKSNNWVGAKLTDCQIRWLLTGTPIQNYKSDIHSLVRLVDMTRPIADLCLHRDKESVGLQLPPIETNIIDVNVAEMDEAEANLINHLHSCLPFADVTLENVDRFIELFDGKGIFPLLTASRQSCLYPQLLTNRWVKLVANGDIDGDIEVPNVNTHSKLNAIVATINSRDRATQKIIFTHYYGETDRLETLLKCGGYCVGKIDGRTSTKQRKNLLNSDKHFNRLVLKRLFGGAQLDVRNKIQEYLAAPDILLLQIKSCCEGLNLQSYNEIYFTSPHWNPAVEDQAIARAHRIGQNKPVKVFKFTTKLPPNGGLMARYNFSLDEYCIFIQERKRELIAELKDRSTTHL
jgi:SNF2 family DNA or RNA helicase